jgi:soluble lytic murein transglycosylase
MGAEDENIFKQIRKKMATRNWKSAEALLGSIRSESYRKAIEVYLKLGKLRTTFSMPREEVIRLMEFNSRNNFLREFESIHRRIEFHYLNGTVRFSDVSKYFDRFRTRDINVQIKLLRDERASLERMKNLEPKRLAALRENLNGKIRRIWVTSDFSADDQEIFHSNFAPQLGARSVLERAEMLVFKWQLSTLERLLPMIEARGWRALFGSIVKIKDYPESLDEILRDVPKNLLENEALLYARVKYSELGGSSEDLPRILGKVKKNSPHGQFWSNILAACGRQLMRARRYEEAYRMVSGYSNLAKGDHTNRIWLSGWLALRFLKNHDLARKHFQDLLGHVSRPANRARAAYWLGRTAEAEKDSGKALDWYRVASGYPLVFYGQLATQRIDELLQREESPLALPSAPSPTPEDALELEKNWLVSYALLCHRYEGKMSEAASIFARLISEKLKTAGEIVKLLELVESLGDTQLTLRMSLEAERRKVFLLANLYPTMRVPDRSNPSRALIHAIAKNESNFVKHAESSRMAQGLMQIIPSTAKALCRELKIKYSSYRLKGDVAYNVKIADHYLGQLAKRFNGSRVLMVASYNAGPEAVARWLEEMGDPRKGKIEDVVDWIESIDYGETRNYVQRVLEALRVYETIFSGER